MSEQRLNIELFKKVRDRIAAIPESYDQSEWVRPSNASPCGAAACLAGETIICNAPTVAAGIKELKRLRALDQYHAVPERAAELLGLEGSWKDFLTTELPDDGGETIIFDGDALYWPRQFRSMFRDGDEADAAVAYLDHIIETGKVLE